MIGTIYIALTGLRGYEGGLRVIANNAANLNTPGFKGSSMQFADIPVTGVSTREGLGEGGLGLSSLGTMLMFQQGELRGSGNDLDCAIDGLGLFTIQDSLGNIRYTRDGQFKFNTDNVLVTANDGSQVFGLDGNGALVPITLADLQVQYAQVTSAVTFSGALSTGMPTVVISNVTVVDRAGTSHALTVTLTRSSTAGVWNVAVSDSTADVRADEQTITFVNGQPDPDATQVHLHYTVLGQEEFPVTLDFSQNTYSYDFGSQSTIGMASQNGHGPGVLQARSFDALGRLVLTYSNGQTDNTRARLALARFNSLDAVKAVGNNSFEAIEPNAWVRGFAGADGFGSIKSATVEMSNVDLSSQFSDLVIMQRGYQASSQVVSTANEMLAELFSMKGK